MSPDAAPQRIECEHLLILVIGLVRAGLLDPGTAFAWFWASRGQSPSPVTASMTEALIRFEGAEAGAIDWRPTETTPEDFKTS